MKRIISLILCVFMFAAAIPVTSFAATAGTTPSNPVSVSFGKTYSGGWDGDNDHLNYYTKFKVSKQGLVTFEFTKPYDDEGEPGGMELILYNSDYEPVWGHSSTESEYNSPKPKYTYTVGLKKGTYYMNVLPGFYVTSGYIDFNYKYTFKATSYCETEPNNSVSKATPLTLGKFYTGYFGSSSWDAGDEYDYFKIPVKKNVKYRFTIKDVEKLANSTTILDLVVKGEDDWNFGGLYSMVDNTNSKGYSYVDYVSPITGNVYLKFDNYSNVPIKYELCVDKVVKKCSKPKLKSVSNTEYGVKTTWGKVSGAESYRVYRKTKGGSWKYLDSTRKTYFTDKTAKSGKKYYYAVRARNSAGYSPLSSSLSKLYLSDPTLKTPASYKKGISLKWTKTSGAEGYIIYRKTGSGSYTKLKTEKGVSNLAYTDKSAKKGKTYTYKVKAYKSKTYSAYSNTKKIKDKY